MFHIREKSIFYNNCIMSQNVVWNALITSIALEQLAAFISQYRCMLQASGNIVRLPIWEPTFQIFFFECTN